jgi:hypothetical protein
MKDPHESQPRLPEYRSDDRQDAWLAALNKTLAGIELPPPAPSTIDASTLPIIYIVGAPRSGTTLLSQLVSRYLEVGYIDNLIARFWLRPSVGIRLSEIVLGPNRRESIAMTSRHGSTSGASGPHEFGYFWRRWLNLDRVPTHHLNEQALAGLDVDGLRDQLQREILASFGRPTVFKNVICGFQAAWLSRVHPRSIFVHISREVEPTTASILQSRFDRYGSYEAWWSLKPSTFEDIQRLADPVSQVSKQIEDCRREFDRELARPGVTSIAVDYQEMCRRPNVVLRRICEAVGRLGVALAPLDPMPPSFEPSKGPVLPPGLRMPR